MRFLIYQPQTETEVGEETYATIMHNASPDTGFGAYESVNIDVYRQQSDFIRLFDYRADLLSMFNAVSGVAEVGGKVGMAIAASQQ